MTAYSQAFKVQSVEKALSRSSDKTLKQIAENLGVGYSTLQTWIRLAKKNKLEKPQETMTKEKSPQDWSKTQRLEAIILTYQMAEEDVSKYCREHGLYPHHIAEWKAEFLSNTEEPKTVSRQEIKRLKHENKQLQKDLNRKNKALSETAALLVLSKKCQAIWGESEVE